ncbi:hypothetical protein MRX96_010993 [Rhipicephalus microplus]
METNVPGSVGDPGEVSETELVDVSSLVFVPGTVWGVSEVALVIGGFVDGVTGGSTSAKRAKRRTMGINKFFISPGGALPLLTLRSCSS